VRLIAERLRLRRAAAAKGNRTPVVGQVEDVAVRVDQPDRARDLVRAVLANLDLYDFGRGLGT